MPVNTIKTSDRSKLWLPRRDAVLHIVLARGGNRTQDLGSSAYYVGGIAEQAVGKARRGSSSE